MMLILWMLGTLVVTFILVSALIRLLLWLWPSLREK